MRVESGSAQERGILLESLATLLEKTTASHEGPASGNRGLTGECGRLPRSETSRRSDRGPQPCSARPSHLVELEGVTLAGRVCLSGRRLPCRPLGLPQRGPGTGERGKGSLFVRPVSGLAWALVSGQSVRARRLGTRTPGKERTRTGGRGGESGVKSIQRRRVGRADPGAERAVEDLGTAGVGGGGEGVYVALGLSPLGASAVRSLAGTAALRPSDIQGWGPGRAPPSPA